MALEYRLQVKTEISLFNFIENYLIEKNISFLKEGVNKGANIYLYEVLGFMISFIISKKMFFDYIINESEFIEREWDYSSNIYFRLDKFYDDLLARLNMMDICINILNNTNEDAVLLFNGDVLILERVNGIVKVNNNFGFWNSEELLAKVKLIM